MYHDLLDIHTVPEVTVKRVVSKEKKPVDPVPSIDDYVKPEYTRINSTSYTIIPRKDERPTFVDLDHNLNERELIRFERIFVSV